MCKHIVNVVLLAAQLTDPLCFIFKKKYCSVPHWVHIDCKWATATSSLM